MKQQTITAEQFRQMHGAPARTGRAAHTPGEMNKREARYAEILELKKREGSVSWYGFEAVKLKLADRTFYTPDFAVVRAYSGSLEFHEVKGHMEDDAAVKFKVAKKLFPFPFYLTDGREFVGDF